MCVRCFCRRHVSADGLGRCEKLCFAGAFASERDCAIWLASWTLSALEVPTSAEHRCAVPSHADLSAAAARFVYV